MNVPFVILIGAGIYWMINRQANAAAYMSVPDEVRYNDLQNIGTPVNPEYFYDGDNGVWVQNPDYSNEDLWQPMPDYSNEDLWQPLPSSNANPLDDIMLVNMNDASLLRYVVGFFQGIGWSIAQAVGLAANLQAESGFNTAAVGDGGRAYGVAQWHPDRQAEFLKFAGRPIQGSNLDDQLSFVHYELTRGNERGAGLKLRNSTTPAQAADIVSRYYERPADANGEATKRAMAAAQIYQTVANTNGATIT